MTVKTKDVERHLARFRSMEMEADRRDAAYALRGLIRSDGSMSTKELVAAQREFGKFIPDIFELIVQEKNDDVVIQTFLELLNDVIIQHEEPEDAGKVTGPSTLDGNGAVLFDWLEVPLRNTDSMLSDIKMFGELLRLIVQPRYWVQMSSIALLTTMKRNRREATETAILAVPQGMTYLMDVLRDDREEVRNEMLLLLLQLTEKNEQLQNFVGYNDGFAQLFAIIESDVNVDIIVQDCLTIIDNVLRGNPLTQKLFGMGECVRWLPMVLELPQTTTGLSEAMSPSSMEGNLDRRGTDTSNGEAQIVDLSRCTPAKLQCISLGLDIVSHLVSGLCPNEILDDPIVGSGEANSGAAMAMNKLKQRRKSGETTGLDANSAEAAVKDAELDQEIRKRHLMQLSEMQRTVGSVTQVLESIVKIALCLPMHGEHEQSQDEEQDGDEEGYLMDLEMITFSEIRQHALHVLGDLVVGNVENAKRVAGISILVGPTSVVSTNNTELHLVPNDDDVHDLRIDTSVSRGHMKTRGTRVNALTGAMKIALGAESSIGERNAASYFMMCILYANPQVQIEVIGHTITPPPEEVLGEDIGLESAPPPGKFAVDSFLFTISQLASEETDERTMVIVEYYDINWRAGRFVEMLLSNNTTCKDMALRIPLDSGDFFDAALFRLSQLIKTFSMLKASRENQPSDESAVGKLQTLKIACVSALRVICEWLRDCSEAAKALAQSPKSLFLFEACGVSSNVKDIDVEGLAALVIGTALMALKQSKKIPQVESVQNPFLRSLFHVVGVEMFTEKLSRLQRCYGFKLTKRSRHVLVRQGVQVSVAQQAYYSKAFVDSFEHTNELIQQGIIDMYIESSGGLYSSSGHPNTTSKSSDGDDSQGDYEALKLKYDSLFQVGEKYKEVIRMQDKRIEELTARMKTSDESAKEEGDQYYDHLKNELDKASTRIRDLERSHEDLVKGRNEMANRVRQLEWELQNNERVKSLEQELERERQKSSRVDDLEKQLISSKEQSSHRVEEPEHQLGPSPDVEELQSQLAESLHRLRESEQQLATRNERVKELEQQLSQAANMGDFESELEERADRLRQVEHELEVQSNRVKELENVLASAEPARQDREEMWRLLEDMLQRTEASPDMRAPHMFQSLAASLESKIEEDEVDRFIKWLQSAIDLCISLEGNSYESSWEMNKICMDLCTRALGPDDPQTVSCRNTASMLEEARNQALIENHGGKGDPSSSDDSKFARLLEEHTQLLLVLANQEIEKKALFDTIFELGGQEAVTKAQRESARLLMGSLKRFEDQAE